MAEWMVCLLSLRFPISPRTPTRDSMLDVVHRMGTKGVFIAGSFVGAAIVLMSQNLVLHLDVANYVFWLGLLVAGAINLAAYRNKATRFEAKPSSSSAGADAHKYAKLLSKLELLRTHQDLPEIAGSKKNTSSGCVEL
jgi:hypothetical protein